MHDSPQSPSDGEQNSFRSGAATLATASIVNGLAAYGIAAVGARYLGADDFAPVAVLWTVLTLVMAAVTFPIQHWVIRTSILDMDEQRVVAALRRVGSGAVGTAVLVAVVSYALRDLLFAGSAWFALFAGLITVEAAVIGVSRGLLMARGQVTRAATVIAGENVIRLAAALIVVAAGGGAIAFGAAIATGVAIVAVYPRSVVPTGRKDVRYAHGRRGPGLTGIAGGTLIAQITLTSPPIVLGLVDGTAREVTAMFATTTVTRAPYLILLAIGLQLMARFTHMYKKDPNSLGAVTKRVLLGTGILAPVGFVLAAWIGPSIVETLFGQHTSLQELPTAIITAGTVVACGALVLTLVSIAVGRGRSLVVIWAAAALCSLLPLLTIDQPVEAVSVSFTVAQIVALVVLAASVLRPGSIKAPMRSDI